MRNAGLVFFSTVHALGVGTRYLDTFSPLYLACLLPSLVYSY